MSATANFIGLDGPNEPFSDTIRKLLASEWIPADHPNIEVLFISEGGQGATTTLTEDDMQALHKMSPGVGIANASIIWIKHDMPAFRKKSEVVVCRVHDEAATMQQSTNSFVFGTQVVYVDIFTLDYRVNNHAKLLEMRDHVDNVILRRQTGPYPKALDGLDSAITGLQNYGIDWVNLGADAERETSEQLSGELLCEFKRALASSS